MALCPLILDVDKLDPSISPSRFAGVVVVLATVASLCRVLLFLSKCFKLNARLMNHNPASIWNSSFNMNHFIFITRPLEINLTGFVPVSKNIPSSVQKVNFKRFKHFYTPSSWVVSQYATMRIHFLHHQKKRIVRVLLLCHCHTYYQSMVP